MQLLTQEQRELRATSRDVLSRTATSERLREVSTSQSKHDDVFWRQIADLGWLALTVPEEFDGLGLGLPELAILAEEFGYALQPCAFIPSSLVAWWIGRHGAAALRARLLPLLATGDAVASWGLQSPGGNGAVHLQGQCLRGTRHFVPDAHTAGHLLVDAISDDGPLLVVVDTDADGVTRTARDTIDLTRQYATVEFDGTPVAEDAVITSPDARAELLAAAVGLQCAESVGVTRRLVEMTISYACARHQFGRPIGSFQAVKHRIADMHIQLEGAAVATGESTCAVQHRRPDADTAVHVAKSWTGRAASFVASEALQLHGGVGFTWEHDLHLFLRRAKVNELLLGSPSWHDERLFDMLAAGGA
jgi:alkylation response protein AidB-like acyl-CoA dehydrogenase